MCILLLFCKQGNFILRLMQGPYELRKLIVKDNAFLCLSNIFFYYSTIQYKENVCVYCNFCITINFPCTCITIIVSFTNSKKIYKKKTIF